MKLISITILFICALTASFTNSILIIAFNLNENYIAKELCINRNDPHSHCNGHCYLSRQIEKQENSSAPVSSSSKEKNEIQLFCNDITEVLPSAVVTIAAMHPLSTSFSKQDYERSFFHPPSVV